MVDAKVGNVVEICKRLGVKCRRMRIMYILLLDYPHACIPKAAAIADSTVMAIFRILLQMFLFSFSMVDVFYFYTTKYTEFHGVFNFIMHHRVH